jgi:D-alanine-D-alanine ligase
VFAPDEDSLKQSLLNLESALVERSRDLALFLVYDRPQRVQERPGLERTFFAQRCVSDAQLNQMIEAFRSVGSYVELMAGEHPLLEALSDGRIQGMSQKLKVIYNGIEGGITKGGFKPGRKSLIPAVADSYGVLCANSSAYACAVGRHKYHYFTLLRALGINAPAVWHYHPSVGWASGQEPAPGTKVIVKSTYESWSVGVTEESIFVVDDSCEERVSSIASEIGQSVTVQEFVSGREICVPVLACPEYLVTPPVEVMLSKAPDDVDAVMTIDDNLRKGGVTYKRFEGPLETVSQLRDRALDVFKILELGSFGRIDFRVDSDGVPWATDIGVSPGMSAESSAFCSLAALGFEHPGFLRLVIAASLGLSGSLAR